MPQLGVKQTEMESTKGKLKQTFLHTFARELLTHWYNQAIVWAKELPPPNSKYISQYFVWCYKIEV